MKVILKKGRVVNGSVQPKGAVVELPDILAKQWIAQGIAEETNAAPKMEPAKDEKKK